VRYVATTQRVLIKNAFTGREIQAMAIENISETTIKQGQWWPQLFGQNVPFLKWSLAVF